MSRKKNLTKAKKDTWTAFSIYIRTRDWDKYGQRYIGSKRAAPCITCDKLYPVEGQGTAQAGHFIPGRNNQVLFDERQVNTQCYNCNMNLKGNWPNYYKKMVDKFELEEVQKMIDESKKTRKYTVPELEEMEVDFKARTREILE